jgi:GTP-binding protein HflX
VTQRRVHPHTADENDENRVRAVLVGVDRGRSDWPVEESVAELERLAQTAGIAIAGIVTQRLDRPHPKTFIGRGKATEVAELASSADASVVIFDDELTPSQQANLEKLFGDVRVQDRTALILDIFALHAISREGKLQVELAHLEYLLPRLRGMWGHLEKERLGGGRGARFGAGESQLETDRRLARKRIGELKRELVLVSGERELQRKQRARSGVFRVSLVGYTNAGKSSLLNALTGADVLAYDMLFATLDSTTRRLDLPEGRQLTITDTVGFINKLPHGLVEAFKSTLDEVAEADLLLHVVDVGSSQREAQMQSVREVLAEIGAHSKPAVLVFNKIDTAEPADVEFVRRRYPDAAFVSAVTGDGIESLVARLAQEAAAGAVTIEVLVPYTRGELVQLAHERTRIITEEHTDQGTLMTLLVPRGLVGRFVEVQKAP